MLNPKHFLLYEYFRNNLVFLLLDQKHGLKQSLLLSLIYIIKLNLPKFAITNNSSHVKYKEIIGVLYVKIDSIKWRQYQQQPEINMQLSFPLCLHILFFPILSPALYANTVCGATVDRNKRVLMINLRIYGIGRNSYDIFTQKQTVWHSSSLFPYIVMHMTQGKEKGKTVTYSVGNSSMTSYLSLSVVHKSIG
jgi:hypothetical protein